MQLIITRSLFYFIASVLHSNKVAVSRFFKFTAVAVGLNLTTCVYAQDLEPRSYSNIPVDMNFIVTGYVHSQGEVSPSPSSSIEDAELNIDAFALGYAHTFGLAGRSSKFDMAISRTCFNGSARVNGDRVEADRCGYTDPNFRLTWNFYGAPALKGKEFGSWKQGVVVGTSLQITAPLGTYDDELLLNAGANRWVFRPGIGMSQKLGRWYYDLIASVRVYGDNKEYYRGGTLAQDPQYTFQGHLIYTLSRGHWLSLNANYFFGGETEKDNIDSQDRQDNSRFGLTYSAPLGVHQSIKLNFSTGVLTRVGNDFDSFGVFWQYRF